MTDVVLTAWAENSSGPGWRNQLVSVLVQSADGTLRLEYLQPSEQTETMRVLHSVAAEVHATMIAEARMLKPPKARR